MSINISTQPNRNGPAFQDFSGRRLAWGVIASVLANLVLWRAAAAVAKRPPAAMSLQPVEITRVIIHQDRKIIKTTPKKPMVKPVVKKAVKPAAPVVKPVLKKVILVHKEIVKPKTVVKPVVHPLITHNPPPPVQKPPKPIQVTQKPPEDAHTHVITALPDTKSAPMDHTALPGGNAPVGKPVDRQGQGNAAVNTPDPVKVQPQPETKPAPKPDPMPVPEKKAESAPVVAPKPDPVPEVKVAPKTKGPTRDAEAYDQVNPTIPDSLKHGDYKSYVRVRVDIDEEGNATPVLRTSSGNTDVDSRVLDALKKWKWKARLVNGVPVKSAKFFRFEFEVQ